MTDFLLLVVSCQSFYWLFSPKLNLETLSTYQKFSDNDSLVLKLPRGDERFFCTQIFSLIIQVILPMKMPRNGNAGDNSVYNLPMIAVVVYGNQSWI